MLKKNSFFGITIILMFAALIIFGGSCAWQKASENSQIIDGQKDAGGCLIAAGYMWCQPKNKCLRIWEESCYEVDEAAISAILSQKYQESVPEMRVMILQDDGNFIEGSISSPQGAGDRGFLAAKINNHWQLIYEGNGPINCMEIEKYNFPAEMLKGYCN